MDTGLAEEFGAPELWSKDEFDRIPKDRGRVIRQVKELYIRWFRSRLAVNMEERPALRTQINLADFSIEKFDEFWSLEVFEDCEEFEFVSKELAREPRS